MTRTRTTSSCSARIRDWCSLTAWCTFTLGLAGALVACDFSGLQDLGKSALDPDKALLETPGERLLAGRFFDVSLALSNRDGPFLVALDEDTANDAGAREVVMASFLDDRTCRGPRAERMWTVWGEETAPALIVLYSDVKDDVGELRLLDVNCREVARFEEARLNVLRLHAPAPRPLLIHQANGDLRLLDNFETGDSRVWATKVERFFARPEGLWTLEDQQLVFRPNDGSPTDGDRQVVMSEVVTLTALSQTSSDFVATREDGSARRVSLDIAGNPEAIPLRDGACQPQLSQGRLLYYAPCDERRLVVQFKDVAEAPRGKPFELVAPLESTPHLGGSLLLEGSQTRAIYFVSEGETEGLGQLHYAELPEELPTGEAKDTLPSATLKADAFGSRLRLRGGVPFQAVEGENDRLMGFVRKTGASPTLVDVRPVLDDVATVNWSLDSLDSLPRGAIANINGESAKLYSFAWTDCDGGRCIKAEEEATGVSTAGFEYDSEEEMIAVVGRLDEGVGELYLLDTSSAQKRPSLPRWAGRKARPSPLAFLAQPSAIAYFSGPRNRVPDLRVYLIDSDFDVLVNERVTWFFAPVRPADGLVYGVTEGDDAGVWYAKAR